MAQFCALPCRNAAMESRFSAVHFARFMGPAFGVDRELECGETPATPGANAHGSAAPADRLLVELSRRICGVILGCLATI